jgi:hypothetical protein
MEFLLAKYIPHYPARVAVCAHLVVITIGEINEAGCAFGLVREVREVRMKGQGGRDGCCKVWTHPLDEARGLVHGRDGGGKGSARRG